MQGMVNSFEKGLNKDFHPNKQPKGFYRDALNKVYYQNGGLSSLGTELGNLELETIIPNNFTIIGATTIVDNIILFLVDPINNYSQIGWILNNNTYERIAPSTDTSNEFNFDINYPIDAVARQKLSGERIVYWTDNNNPVRFLNIDDYINNPIPDAELATSSTLVPTKKYPNLNVVSVLDEGALPTGIYQVGIRYKDSNLTPSSILALTNVIPIVDEPNTTAFNEYDGAANGTSANKAIKLSLSNLDTTFSFMDIILFYYEGASNVLKTKIIQTIQVTESIDYILASTESDDTVEIGPEEILKQPISYETAKAIEQKDDRLFLANLKDSRIDIYNDLQEIANNIIVKYTIDTHPYPTINGLEISDPDIFRVLSVSGINIEDGANADNPDSFLVTVEFSKNIASVISSTLQVDTIPDVPSISSTIIDNVVTFVFQAYVTNDLTPSFSTTFVLANSRIKFRVESTDGEIIDTGTDPNDGFTIPYTLDESEDNIGTSLLAGYKNNLFTTTKKGYRRGEVYSLGFGVIWNDGSKSPVFHIPGNDKLTLTTTDADTTTKLLGTYVSTSSYPSGQGYINGNIRHHKMPTLQQEPHFELVGNEEFIKILGLNFENIIISDEIKEKIQGFYFARELRDTPDKRSVLSTGVFNHIVKTSDGRAILNHEALNDSITQNPYNPLTDPYPPINNNGGVLNGMGNNLIIFADRMFSPVSGNRRIAKFGYSDAQKDLIGFFSPETILNDGLFLDINEVSQIRRELTLICDTPQFAVNQKTLFRKTPTGGFPVIGFTQTISIDKFPCYRALLNYRNRVIPSVVTANIISKIEIGYGAVSNFNVDSNGLTIRNTDGAIGFHRYPLLRLDSDFEEETSTSIKAVMESVDVLDPFSLDANESPDNIQVLGGSVRNYLCSLIKNLTNQYGDINDSEYVEIIDVLNKNATSVLGVFGGDTFIGKFAVSDRIIVPAKGIKLELRTVSIAPPAYINQWSTPNDAGKNGNGALEDGLDFRSIRYFFTESNINFEYRHVFEDPEDPNANTIPYFPRELNFDTVALQARDAISYNTLYSSSNTVRSYFSRPITNDAIVSKYITRIIYSEKGTFDAIPDNYRIFLQESYHDIPSNKGEIWDLFIHNNTLYAHTPKTLWKTNVNERTVLVQANTTEQVVLGTGGLFPIPSLEVITLDGGYGGSISQWGGIETPYGYVFFDSLQGKLFILNQGLTELSLSGMISYFRLKQKEKASIYVDNPFNKLGIHGIYDHENHRFIMYFENEGISYSFLNKAFISRHDSVPNFSLTLNNDIIQFNKKESENLKVYQLNKGLPRHYFNERKNSLVEIVANENPFISKVFDNIIASANVTLNDEEVPMFYNTIQVMNSIQDSGVLPLVVSKIRSNSYHRAVKINDEYRMYVPRDTSGNRMKDKYNIIKLEQTSNDNSIIQLHNLVTLIRQNFL